MSKTTHPLGNPILNKMIASSIEDYHKFLNDNKDSVNKMSFSHNYGIYSIETEPLKLDSHYPNNTNANELYSNSGLDVKTFEVKNFTGLMFLMNEMIEDKLFYGAIVVDNIDKTPYSIFSYNFYQYRDRFLNRENFSIYCYFDKCNAMNKEQDNKIKEQVINYLSKMDIKNITIKTDSTDDSIELMFMKKDRELEGYGLHLSDLHQKIDMSESVFAQCLNIDKDMVFEVEPVSQSEMMIDKTNWAVELSAIDNGFVIPAYGWFKNIDGNMIELVASSKHPNISSNGGSYCTGIHIKNSITGISELSYGNLNSPMNGSIYKPEQLPIAKGFIEVYWLMLKSIDIPE